MTTSEKMSAQDLLSKIDWEGGFYDAFFSYGLTPDDYDLEPEMLQELKKIVEGIEPFHVRADSFMRKLQDLVDDQEETDTESEENDND